MLGTSDIEHSNDHNDVKDLSFRNHINQLQRSVNVSQMDTNANDGHGLTSIVNGSSNNHNNITSNSTNAASASANTSNNPTSSTPATGGLSLGGSNSTAQQQQSTAGLQQPHQAPVITSTAPPSLLHHTDSSNHDFDSSREPILHTDTSNMHSPPPRDTLLSHHHHLNNTQHSHLSHHQDSLMQGRLRNYSESSHDIEHNNNYKYKNHIKERFNHELHDEETSSEHGPAPPMLQSEHSHAHSDHSKDGTEPEIAPIIAKKRKLAEAASSQHNENTTDDTPISRINNGSSLLSSISRDEKPFGPFSDIKTEASSGPVIHNKSHLSAPTSTTAPLSAARSFAVPIFALHSQGTYYVPLNVDYNVLIPFLNGVDLLEKNFTAMPVVHPININVNFMPTSSASLLAVAAAAVAAGKQQPPTVINGQTVATAAANAVAAVAKAKLEAITNVANGW